MKRLALVSFTALLAISWTVAAWGFASSPARSGAVVKGVDLSGKVSADGKTLRTDDDNAWTVTNAERLKGLENSYVTVKCRMDPNRKAIRVLFVIEPATTHTAYVSDSAFRR